MNQKYLTKYKELINACRTLNFSDYEIEDKIYLIELLDGYRPITFKELEDIFENEDELNKLLSVCWHYGKHRCDCIGISHVNFETHEQFGHKYTELTFSDSNGDPSIEIRDMNQEINDVGDGEWNYGLFKKK